MTSAPQTSPSPARPGMLAVWVTAVRPFAYTASAGPVALAAALSAFQGVSFAWLNFVLALAGVLAVHTAGNLINDAVDYRRGTDRGLKPSSGAVVRGWITSAQAERAGQACLALAGCIAAVLTWRHGWPVAAFAAGGAAIAFLYTRDRFCLKYAGLGDAAVFLAFGPLPTVGTHWVLTGRLDGLPLLWGCAPGCLAAAILHANNWRDAGEDRGRGCRTLAGMLGPKGCAAYYRGLLVAPLLLAVLLWAASLHPALRGLAPRAALAVLAALPAAVRLARATDLAALDARTAQYHLAFTLLLVLAFVAG
jgi:1,4-dihydroxy-2-naphthoate polyprenyltransferase